MLDDPYPKICGNAKAQIPLHPLERRDSAATAKGGSSRPQTFKAATFLANHPLFGDLGQAPRGKVLIKRDDPCSGFHIVVYGQIKLAVLTFRG